MKIILKVICISAIALTAPACASQKSGQSAWSENSMTLDAAISRAAAYFVDQLPNGAKTALIPFDAPTGRLSDYIFDELWRHFEDSGKFVMVDRRNLDRIEMEVKHQLESGRVDDNFVVSLSRQYGAQTLVYGQISSMGGEFRMTVYATDVEKASSSQRAYNIRPDDRLSALLNAPPDEEVERAISFMARSVNQKTIVTVGRISYADTQTVTGLSAWLKNCIIASAQKQQDKFQVASDSESVDFAIATRGLTIDADGAIQAVVMGNYSPLDNNAEVLLRLISTRGNKSVLASSRFLIPAAELQRRRLSLLPEKDNTVISKAEFEAKQKAVESYAGKNNKWDFTVTPDVLDGIYYDEDYMTMRLFSAKDCYFRIIHVDVNGQTQVIYPAAPNDNNFIRAGQTRSIPDNTRFRMGAPFGEEMILASGYERPFMSGPLSVSAPLSANSIIRGLEVESDNNMMMQPSATAKFSYTILPR